MKGQQINRIVKALDRHINRKMIAVAMNLTAELRERTPIDTGWARSNWIPTVISPAEGTVGSRESVTYGAQNAGIASLAGYMSSMGPIYITNRVPYLPRLNNGSSSQAPARFVEAAVDRVLAQEKVI